MKKAATKTGNDSYSLDMKKTSSNKPSKQKVKEKALEAFLRAGLSGYYQIEAYPAFQVTCLHTYISNFQKQGIKFNRKRIAHLNSDGGHTMFMCYWLADQEAYNKALSTVNFMRSQRGVEPLNDLPPYPTQKQAA